MGTIPQTLVILPFIFLLVDSNIFGAINDS
jgi:hypothetical protein